MGLLCTSFDTSRPKLSNAHQFVCTIHPLKQKETKKKKKNTTYTFFEKSLVLHHHLNHCNIREIPQKPELFNFKVP